MQRKFQRQWPWALAYLAIASLLTAVLVYAWQDYQRDVFQREATMAQDLLWQEQEIRGRLQSNQNVLENLAYGLAADSFGQADFRARAEALMKSNPEIISIEWVNARGERGDGFPNFARRPESLVSLDDSLLTEVIDGAATLGYPMVTNVIWRNSPQMVHVVPFFHQTEYQGAVLAVYDLSILLLQRVPWWMVQRYQLQLVDSNNQVIAPNRYHARLMGEDIREVPFGGASQQGLRLLAKPADPVGKQANFWLVGLISTLLLLLVWALKMLRLRMQERQLAESALRDEILFRSAMENSLVTGLRAMDTDGKLSYVNRAFADMVGWPESELVGAKPPMPFWPPECLEQCAKAYQSILLGDCPANGFELRFMRNDGERFDVRLYSSKLVDSHGLHRGWMASMYDITELKQEREALASSRQQLRTVLAGLEVAVSVSDLETGVMLYRNRHHSNTFSIPQQAEAYCLLQWRVGINKDSQAFQGVASTDSALITGSSYNETGELLTDYLPLQDGIFEAVDAITGRTYQIEQRIVDWVSNRSAVLEICTDITARQQAQDLERTRNDLVQHTARLVNMGELASSLAHELNQPLAAIASYSSACETMLYKPNPPIGKVQETLVKMTQQARRAGQIIRGIRQFVVKRAPTREVCELSELISVPLQLLGPMAHKLKVSMVLDLPSDLPSFVGDAVMLEQVLLNLIKNGLEAMSETPIAQRKIVIRAALLDEMLQVTVADHGSGLADPAQLFQPFYTTKSEGMGMGLNICRSVIEQHRGHLWAEPNPGGGTQMRFRLPLNTNEDTP
ncbi:PAS domain-containing sensor histidine kinase [Deefgea rivuli]|uniref:PAS domain-containing sensor histidine kinase n=1 Tax=Deefgea rivuli TaxID=400948 RepID=UPI00146F9D9C|nr:PAS domain-containing sensor histidine kinase [Deefgea rivuli]